MSGQRGGPQSLVTPLEHTAIGGLSGVLETCIMQPTVAIKNALQEGRAIPTQPRLLYRGIVVNASSMAPITATQFGATKLFETCYIDALGRKPQGGDKMLLAGLAGATSALAAAPPELVVVQQQRSDRKFIPQMRALLAEHGLSVFSRGLVPCMAREFIYCMCYMGLQPVLHENLHGMRSFQDMPTGTSFTLSVLAAGVTAAVFTQPFDTIKTRMQAFLDAAEHPQYRSMTSTALHVAQQEGAGKLWAGILPRGGRILMATMLLGIFRDTFSGALEAYKSAAAALQPHPDTQGPS